MVLCMAKPWVCNSLKSSYLSSALQVPVPPRAEKVKEKEKERYRAHAKCKLTLPCGRRNLLSTALFLLYPLNALPTDVKAIELPKALDKYVKRKKLDPLETYVPAIILSQAQFEDIEKYLQSDKPKYSDSRSLLRSGPAASLRINIRAVAQYASEAGKGKVASDAVDECLSALEDLDSLLLRASRDDAKASTGTMKSKVETAVIALDRLLQTVPSSILEKGKVIADAYRETTDPALQQEGGNKNSESEMKRLQEILEY